jgi:GNAT superfamily N-acetyltransferase
MDIRITTLAEHPEWVSWVADEHFREWGALHPSATLEGWTADRRGTLKDGIPITLLAVDGSQPVATAGLVECDMATHPELSPWLAGVYVTPAWRQRGIGALIVKAATRLAAEWGVRRLYLHTETAQPFYERLGWRRIGAELYSGLPSVIMDRDPAA